MYEKARRGMISLWPAVFCVSLFWLMLLVLHKEGE
jgi:hypothetical protein